MICNPRVLRLINITMPHSRGVLQYTIYSIIHIHFIRVCFSTVENIELPYIAPAKA